MYYVILSVCYGNGLFPLSFLTASGPKGDPRGLFPVGVPAKVYPLPLGTIE